MLLPTEAQPLLAAFLPHFPHPTDPRFVGLLAAAILTTSRRTGANVLRTVGRGHRDTMPATDESSPRVRGPDGHGAAPYRGSSSGIVSRMARSTWWGTTPPMGTPGPGSTAKVAIAMRFDRPIRSRRGGPGTSGGGGRPGDVPIRHPPMGVARPRRSVPHPGSPQGRGRPTPNAGPVEVPRAPSPRAPSPGSERRFRRGFRVRGSCGGPVLPPARPATHAGPHVSPRCQSVCPAPAVCGNRATAGQRRATAETSRGGRDGGAAEAHRGLVRTGEPACRNGHRHRARVQGRRRVGPDPVGPCPGRDRHPPGRGPVHDRHRSDGRSRDRDLLWPVGHRDNVSGMPLGHGAGVDPGGVAANGVAGRTVSVRTGRGGRRVVPRLARIEANGWGHRAGEGHGDAFGRPDRGSSSNLGGGSFSPGEDGRGWGKTPGECSGTATDRVGPNSVNCTSRAQLDLCRICGRHAAGASVVSKSSRTGSGSCSRPMV